MTRVMSWWKVSGQNQGRNYKGEFETNPVGLYFAHLSFFFFFFNHKWRPAIVKSIIHTNFFCWHSKRTPDVAAPCWRHAGTDSSRLANSGCHQFLTWIFFFFFGGGGRGGTRLPQLIFKTNPPPNRRWILLTNTYLELATILMSFFSATTRYLQLVFFLPHLIQASVPYVTQFPYFHQLHVSRKKKTKSNNNKNQQPRENEQHDVSCLC